MYESNFGMKNFVMVLHIIVPKKMILKTTKCKTVKGNPL